MMSFYKILVFLFIVFVLIIFLCVFYRIKYLYKQSIEKYKENEIQRSVVVVNPNLSETEIQNMRILRQFQNEKKEDYENYPPIYCVMLTGKNDERIDFAGQSIRNFLLQDYPHKFLYIFNHHPHLNVLDTFAKKHGLSYLDMKAYIGNRIVEIYIEKRPHTTLGMMRNISLQYIPLNSLWITWDDDDFRSHDFLTELYRVRHEKEVDAVAFTQRYEHNANTNFSWRIKLKKGFPIVLAPKNPLIEYENKTSMEDINLLSSIKDLGLKIAIFDNNPRLYIRFVHDNNTSRYVNSNKSDIQKSKALISEKDEENFEYLEKDIDTDEKKYVLRNVNDLLATKRK